MQGILPVLLVMVEFFLIEIEQFAARFQRLGNVLAAHALLLRDLGKGQIEHIVHLADLPPRLGEQRAVMIEKLQIFEIFPFGRLRAPRYGRKRHGFPPPVK